MNDARRPTHIPSKPAPARPATHRERWLTLSPAQRAAWVGFLRSHDAITGTLDRDLERGHGLSLRSYDVLVQLSLAGDRGRRMSELADAVLLSRSGLTRLVERLERAGLVQRRAGDPDSRQTFAVVTEAGLDMLADATETHLRGVAERFLDRLTEDQLALFADAGRRLLEDVKVEPAPNPDGQR